MRLLPHPDQQHVTVVLSRRNVLALLHKLAKTDSARTLLKSFDNGWTLTLQVESDAEHYVLTEDPVPGRMTDDTETFIGKAMP
jgi:hypothetical protein